tara:strand:- start:3605 stop:4501 length:897 start_codon:yes stop_codon:yes gene_type:complete
MIKEILDKKNITTINFLLNNLFNIKFEDDEKIPLCTQLSLDRENLIKVKKYNYKYYVRDNVNYKRGILFFFKDRNSQNKVVIIDENFKFYNLNVIALDEYYNGTVLEILYNNENIILVDSYCINCINTMRYKFIERRLELDTFIHNLITNENIKINIIEINNWEKIHNLNFNEEIIIVPEELPIKFGLNYSYFVWKNNKNINFSLNVRENNENLDLYTTNFKQFKLFATINNKSDDILNIKNLVNYTNNCIVEFNIDEEKLTPQRVLVDKQYPSNIRIIERSILNKNENIKLDEIFSI